MATKDKDSNAAEVLNQPEPGPWRDNLVSSFNTLCQDFRALKLKYEGNPEATFEFTKFEESLSVVSSNVTAVRDNALAKVVPIENVDPGPVKSTNPAPASGPASSNIKK